MVEITAEKETILTASLPVIRRKQKHEQTTSVTIYRKP